ncbi:MAG: mycofactocin biosynthesis glycosyltransferase MftF, partial [Actinomycetota bacterium]
GVLTHHARFVVDSSWRRPADGTVVFAGSPLKVFRLGEAGKAIAELLEHGQQLPIGHESLTDRLLDAGAIHRLISPDDELPFRLSDITVVIPAFVQSPDDATRLESVVSRCTDVFRVIVVDDGSPHALPTLGNAHVITLATNRGPGAARNTGLARVTTPLVAFIDLDITLPIDALSGLIAHFADERVGIVAPRVLGDNLDSTIGKYERIRSPLDLGPSQARIAPGTRVSYVPSAVWLCRTDAIRAVDGFDESLRSGEDVDALWRVIGAGWRCRYQPEATACHLPRTTLHDFINQRRMYGRSAAGLSARHPGAVPPLRVSAYSAGMWTLIACGSPFLSALVGAYTVVTLARKLRDVPNSTKESLRLAGLGNLHAARLLASAVTRAWWPIAVTLALVSRRARIVLISAAVIPAMYEWWSQRPTLDPLRFLALRILDDASYGIGVWEGAIAHRSSDALTPNLSSWPTNAR